MLGIEWYGNYPKPLVHIVVPLALLWLIRFLDQWLRIKFPSQMDKFDFWLGRSIYGLLWIIGVGVWEITNMIAGGNPWVSLFDWIEQTAGAFLFIFLSYRYEVRERKKLETSTD